MIFYLIPGLSGVPHAEAYYYVGKVSTPAQVAAVEHALGLDLPVVGAVLELHEGHLVRPCAHRRQHHGDVRGAVLRLLVPAQHVGVGA